MNGISLQRQAADGKPSVSAAPRRDVDARPAGALSTATPVQPEGGLLARFLGHRVEIRLTDGEAVSGVLHTIGKFELLVTLANGSSTCLFKNACASVSEAKP